MASVGASIDRVVGTLSHLLHLRAAQLNTVDDLGPYLGCATSTLFPAPVAPRDVTVHRLRRAALRFDRLAHSLRWQSQHVPLCPRYCERHAGEYSCNQTVTARWVHPRSGPRRKALVYVHGWLEPGPWIEEAILLPRLYEDLGADVLHLDLPFHGSRNPRTALFHGEFFWSADLVRSLEAVRQSCIDTRTLVAWLRSQGYDEVGVMGISLGGSIAMLLACLAPLPDYIVPIVAHLQLAQAVEDAPILWRVKADLERFGIRRERRRQIFDELGLEHLKPLLPRERQLWIEARNDAYIAAPLVEAQWRDWGEPPIVWIPGGHVTFPLSLGRITGAVRDFHASLGAGARDRRDDLPT